MLSSILVSSTSLGAAGKKQFVTWRINKGLINLCLQMLSFCYTIAFEDSQLKAYQYWLTQFKRLAENRSSAAIQHH